MYEQYIRVSEEVLSLTELTSVLIKMAVFCSYFMEWDDMGAMVKQGDDMTRVARFGEEPSRVAYLNIVMPYTDEEECWISEQVSESIVKIGSTLRLPPPPKWKHVVSLDEITKKCAR